MPHAEATSKSVTGHTSVMSLSLPLCVLMGKWIQEEGIITASEIQSFTKPEAERLLFIFLDENVPEWKQLVKETAERGSDWGLIRLKDMRDGIINICRKHKDILRAAFKLGAKSSGRVSFQLLAKNAIRIGVKQTLKGAAMPVGAVADIAQAGLEYAGYEEVGEKIGVAGNVASGAMVGFALGGPVGAGVGVAGGALFWLGGQTVGYMFGKMIEEHSNTAT